MADVDALVAAVTTALQAVPGTTFYDGQVPTSVPETGGYPDPYIVLWAGVGDFPEEPAANGSQPTDSLVWDFQTTAVGATPAICRGVAKEITARLVNLRVGTGKVRRVGFTAVPPMPDNQVTPARFMLPLQWRLYTN